MELTVFLKMLFDASAFLTVVGYVTSLFTPVSLLLIPAMLMALACGGCYLVRDRGGPVSRLPLLLALPGFAFAGSSVALYVRTTASLAVAHNFPFDFSFMTAEFGYESRIFRYNEQYDTMRELKYKVGLPSPNGHGRFKYPKLIELADFYEIYDYDVTRKSIELFGNGAASHDARFDVTQTYMSLFAAAEKDEKLKEKLEKYL